MGRPRRVLLATLIGLAALELVLQAGSLIVHWTAGAPEPVTGNGPTILCIGDSYTYGLGASGQEKSYPGVLQEVLPGRLGTPVRVANAGWPGQDSRAVLRKLPAQLETHAPRLVLILVGLNDSWSLPERLDLAEARQPGPTDGWRLRWRTGLLLAILFGGGTEEWDAPTTTSPAAAGGDTQGKELTSFERAVAELQEGNTQLAISLFERALDEEPGRSATIHQGLVQAHLVMGQRQQASAALEWLQRQWRDNPDRLVAEALTVSLMAMGERREAAATARTALQRFADSFTLWWVSGRDHYEAGRLGEAERDFDRALEEGAAADPGWRAAALRDLARSCGASAPRKAVWALLQAQRIDRDVARGRTVVEALGASLPEAIVRQSLQEMSLAGEDLVLARQLFTSSLLDESEHLEVLAYHLRQAVLACREDGVVPVLLTYPFHAPKLEAVQERVAAELDVELISVWRGFAPIVQEQGRDALFIADGHCNDAGYALMGRLAADAAARLLRR